MKTVKLTNEELATLKTALILQIQSIDREICFAEREEKNVNSLLEIKQQYEQAFEALSYVHE